MSRVVVATRLFAPEPAAASFRLAALVDALVAQGDDVTVLTTRPRPGSEAGAATPADPPVAGGARVRRWPVLRDASGYVRGYLPYLSFDFPLALRLLVTRRPDVVVVEPPPTTGMVVRAVCALRRAPYVYYAADVWSDAVVSDGGSALVRGVLGWLESGALRGARGVLAVLPAVADRVRALAGRPVDLEVVPHGIDTAVFTRQPVDTDTDADRPDEAPPRYLVYTGTTSSWHGADVFVRALAAVRAHVDVDLVLLGHGSQWEEIGALADELVPGHVHRRPMVPPAEAARWLRHAEAAVVSLKPGQNYDMAFPTKLLAAVACGTPVVFSGVGPARDLMAAHDLGRAVAFDADDVAAALVDLLASAEVTDPTTRATRRDALAEWAAEHVSLQGSGAQAARAVRRWALQRPGGPTAQDSEDQTA
ncbi:glycosyl transferase [Flavimobilis marinus]|uniref:D-inositol 3-phosphate glycosyltransferase n=1 Tax=Flavimobilis marinus TaxID=285351 RepID=A0A1I2HFS5_9MICO|nr:glycosyltransferase [Flavimobilis marinus]GHG57691.1 glycosyl transferase [Flavimobilis marinus]SFF28479.1 Glycosyltransferase involved in cell wall bisynthesis [Flavimobilis marinus]